MSESRYQSDREFEDDVRRVFEALFSLPAGTCQTFRYPNGKETDGRVEIDGTVHLIEATTSSREQSVKDNTGKLRAAKKLELEGGVDNVVLWMIVELTPEGDLVARAKERKVRLRTLAQLRNQFFDAKGTCEATGYTGLQRRQSGKSRCSNSRTTALSL